MKYKLKDVCAKEVSFKIVDGKLKNVEFKRGCPGNLKALSLLLEGMGVDEVISKLKGISCGGKPTSCTDQFAKALEKTREKGKKK